VNTTVVTDSNNRQWWRVQ